MVSVYKVFEVVIPEENGYAGNPDLVEKRVIPHVREIEPYSELEHVGDNAWKLTTPHLGANLVARLLRVHYGFEVEETGTVTK